MAYNINTNCQFLLWMAIIVINDHELLLQKFQANYIIYHCDFQVLDNLNKYKGKSGRSVGCAYPMVNIIQISTFLLNFKNLVIFIMTRSRKLILFLVTS